MATCDDLYNRRMICAMMSLEKALPRGHTLYVRGLSRFDPLNELWTRERRLFRWKKGKHYRQIGRVKDSLCMSGGAEEA